MWKCGGGSSGRVRGERSKREEGREGGREGDYVIERGKRLKAKTILITGRRKREKKEES